MMIIIIKKGMDFYFITKFIMANYPFAIKVTIFSYFFKLKFKDISRFKDSSNLDWNLVRIVRDLFFILSLNSYSKLVRVSFIPS